jgi:hypothetical protein
MRLLIVLLVSCLALNAFADEVVFATEEELSAFDQLVMQQKQKELNKSGPKVNLQKSLELERQSRTTTKGGSIKSDLIKSKSEKAASPIRGKSSRSKSKK